MSPTLDLDLKKRIVFRIASDVFNLFEVEDFENMIHQDLILYNVLQENMPELLDYMKGNGKAKGVTSEYVRKLLEPENLEQFINKYTSKFKPLYNDHPDGKTWLKKQVEHLLKSVWKI